MTALDIAFDGSLSVAILSTAGLLLASPGFLRAAVLFIAFGLLMSLAWVRLMAPDIALAEAAIGTGITGVLLMDALRHMEWEKEIRQQRQRPEKAPSERAPRTRLSKALAGAAALALTGLLLAGIARITEGDPSMAERAQAQMSDVSHPVTAVLLIFRGLDTMLELGILLLALLGTLAIRGSRGLATVALSPPRDPILSGIVRILVPLSVLVAGYLLWLGTFAPGGAFQSGVVLGAAGVLLWLSPYRSVEAAPSWLWHTLAMLGFAMFLALVAATLVWSEWALQFPGALMPALLEVLELAAAISIGAILAALFVGLHPSRESFSVGGTD